VNPAERCRRPAGRFLARTVGALAALGLVALWPLLPGPVRAAAQEAVAQEAAAQEAGEAAAEVFGERIEVSLVGLDVWVSDEDGEPVTGLDVGDFTLRHAGDPVTITHFTEVGAAAAGEAGTAPPVAPGAAPADPPPPARRPSLADSPPGYLVVYFDQNRLSPRSYPRVAEALEQILSEGAQSEGGVPAEHVLVLRQDERLHLEVPLGSSAEDVAAAVERITAGSHRGLAHASGLDQARNNILEIWEHSESVARGRRGACDRFLLRAVPAVGAWTRERSADVARTLANLDTAAALLAGLPGVKGVLYVSDGLDLAPGTTLASYASEFCPERGRSWETRAMGDGMGKDFLRLAAHLNTHGVTLHAIQASGLGGGREGSASQRATTAPVGSGIRFDTRQRQAARSGMSLLATQTGGRAVFNRGDLVPELTAISRGLAHYYSLAFPPPEGSGPVHRVEVEVGDPSLTVRYRRTIRAPDPDERFEEGLASALHLGLVSNVHDLSLGVAETGTGEASTGEGGTGEGGTAEGGTGEAGTGEAGTGEASTGEAGSGAPLLNLLIMVPLDHLLFAPGPGAGATGAARVEVRVLAVGLGPAAGPRARSRPIRLEESFRLRRPANSAGSEVARQRATLPIALPLPPGPHRLAVALRDALSGEASFVITDLTVPGPVGGEATQNPAAE